MGFWNYNERINLFAKKAPGPHDNFDSAMDSMYTISFSTASKVLFIQDIISKDDKDNLDFFNSARNNMIHKIYYDNNKGWVGYPAADYDKAFKIGLDFMEKFSEIIHKSI
ncbi:MAG: hypothetical protein ACOYU0_07920 [Nitrospirota bacterium]